MRLSKDETVFINQKFSSFSKNELHGTTAMYALPVRARCPLRIAIYGSNRLSSAITLDVGQLQHEEMVTKYVRASEKRTLSWADTRMPLVSAELELPKLRNQDCCGRIPAQYYIFQRYSWESCHAHRTDRKSMSPLFRGATQCRTPISAHRKSRGRTSNCFNKNAEKQ